MREMFKEIKGTIKMLNKKVKADETIKIDGYSVGDESVGIWKIDFSIDTGLTELTEDDKTFIIKTILRNIYEIHDNGDLRFQFSDEESDDFGFMRRLTYEMVKKIDEEEILSFKRQMEKLK